MGASLPDVGYFCRPCPLPTASLGQSTHRGKEVTPGSTSVGCGCPLAPPSSPHRARCLLFCHRACEMSCFYSAIHLSLSELPKGRLFPWQHHEKPRVDMFMHLAQKPSRVLDAEIRSRPDSGISSLMLPPVSVFSTQVECLGNVLFFYSIGLKTMNLNRQLTALQS